MADAPDLLAENQLLRDFYDAWEFFHAVRNDPHESPEWNRTRLEMTAQALVEASQKVKAHIREHSVKH